MQRFKVYFKLVLIVAMVVFCLVLIVANRNNAATVWFFRRYENINVLWLILFTAVLTIITYGFLLMTRYVIRDMKALKRQTADRERQQRDREFAAKLAEHDRKLKEEQSKDQVDRAS